jgi:AraC family transcriptional regulator, transcriptional activator FtrA
VAETTGFDKNPPMKPKPIVTRSVVCVAYNHWSLFEAGIAHEVFGIERPEFEVQPYRFRVAQAEPGPMRVRGGLVVMAHGGLRLLASAAWVIVPGWRDHAETPPPPLLHALRRAHARGARLLSICTGAFVLAAAGLLDGRRATTHWRFAQAFRERFPAVRLEPDMLYVDEGDIVTSAGSAAGIDACLHVVRRDHGPELANIVARTMVTAPHRAGGQAQFVPAPVAREAAGAVTPAMEWARGRLAQPLRVADLAQRAAMSERTFLRRFTEQVGIGPKQWLRRERVATAQRLLETSKSPLEAIAEATGFGSVTALRAAFHETVGAPPSEHRRAFQARREHR